MPVVIGIDSSLTGTGVAVLKTGEERAAFVATVTSNLTDNTLASRLARISKVTQKIFAQVDLALDGDVPDLLVIEQPAFSRTVGKQHDRAGLWWSIVTEAKARGYKVADISPTSRSKYGSGKGTASKDVVMLAAAKRYPEIDIADNNQADAVLLAAMALRALNADNAWEHSLPAANLAALASLVLP